MVIAEHVSPHNFLDIRRVEQQSTVFAIIYMGNRLESADDIGWYNAGVVCYQAG